MLAPSHLRKDKQMDKIMLDMINGAIVYASILSACEYVKDECDEHPSCINCKFLNVKDGFCVFKGLPSCWNLNDIEKALKGE